VNGLEVVTNFAVRLAAGNLDPMFSPLHIEAFASDII
jgi:hypothetical protein